MSPSQHSPSQRVCLRVVARFASRVFLSLLLFLAFGTPNARAQSRGPKTVSATATLTILQGSVQLVQAGSARAQPATDGMSLAQGDRVLTGPKSDALVTFLDGSTLEVMPESDVAVKKAELGRAGSSIAVKINVGMVWARVVRLADQKGFSLESNTATATVHDGLIGAHHFADGKFVCWTRAGELTVADPRGRTLVVLTPGQKTEFKPGQAPAPQTFFANQSALNVVAPSNVLPLILMDDEVRVAGFVAPGVEVNQVFGSLTGIGEDGARTVEVPAGKPGPFVLILEGRDAGDFRVALTGSFKGQPVYRQELTGHIERGQRLFAEIAQTFDPAQQGDPKTAKVQAGAVAGPYPITGPLPGKVLLSPDELAAAGGNR